MKSNIHQTPLRLTSIPSVWTKEDGRTIHGYHTRTDLHYVDGWRDYVAPEYDPATQRLGELIYDAKADVVTHALIDKIPEEIAAEKRALIPTSITPTQGRIQLKRMGLLDVVNQTIKSSPDDALQIYWEYSLSWDRDNPYIAALAAQLGMSEEDLDEFYAQAAQI